MHIDHLAIAVNDLDKAIDYWQNAFGYHQATEIVLNTRQKVYVVFLEKEESLSIKLIKPSEESSTVTNFLKKGGSLHHICFKTDNLETTTKELKDKGLISVVPPQPGEAFDNNLIAFFLAPNRLNVEVIDTDVRAKRINP